MEEEKLCESAVEPPVAADNMRAVTKTATNILCFVLSFSQILVASLNFADYSCKGVRAILVVSFIYIH